ARPEDPADMTAASGEAALRVERTRDLAPERRWWRTALRLARQNPVGAFSLLVLVLLCLSAVFAGPLAPYSPKATLGNRLEAPSTHHLLGTDRIGRDMLSRILYGGRISLGVGFLSVTVGTLIGAAIGMISGFAGGWVDLLVQ